MILTLLCDRASIDDSPTRQVEIEHPAPLTDLFVNYAVAPGINIALLRSG